MEPLKEAILDCLKDLKGSGQFMSSGTMAFRFPGLEVRGVGEIAYPVNALQARALIQAAHKAPFGKGHETILDDKVRSAWEIDADALIFNGKSWETVLKEILDKVKPDLGLDDYAISAQLYKLLIYEEGDFFLPHKDSEKQKGMFGTLVIGLPSRYTGGELVVSFEGRQAVADFASAEGASSINYAAFYADCDHEVKKLLSGYRVCLVYNLMQRKAGKTIQPVTVRSHAHQLAEIFARQRQAEDATPSIILLGHQYTPENFSAEALKLNDRPKATAIMLAAKDAGCYAGLCLVTSYLVGAPAYGGYYGGYDDDGEEDANAPMEEVYEQTLYIEHWANNDIPALGNVQFEDEELITSFTLAEGEPVVKASTGYMGNYGPDLMHWYHYGAVMVWSPEINAQLLLQEDAVHQLEWLAWFNRDQSNVSDVERQAMALILSKGPMERHTDEEANYNAVADWIIGSGDESFFAKLSPALAQFYFIRINVAHWLKLLSFFSHKHTVRLFEQVTAEISLPVLQQLLAITRQLLKAGMAHDLVMSQLESLPLYFTALVAKKEEVSTVAVLRDLFWLEEETAQTENWVQQLAVALTGNATRNYIHKVLAPALQAQKKPTALSRQLSLVCSRLLQERVDQLPQIPADWSRELPSTADHKPEWQILKTFLASPHDSVFDYRKRQSDRDAMERAIQSVTVDLKTQTIKTGSPHILRITKTQDAYHRAMKIWKEDSALLDTIKRRLKEQAS